MTLQELLSGDEPTERPAVDVPRELLADLYDHPVIITPEYIGRDRRISQRSEWTERASQVVTIDRRAPIVPAVRPSVQLDVDRTGRHTQRSLGTFEALVIIAATLALAVPLTLMAASGKASAIPSTPAVPHTASIVAGSNGLRTLALERASARAARRAARTAARARATRSRVAKRAATARREAAARLHHRRAVELRRAQAERERASLARKRAASRAEGALRDRTRRY
jgi:hypothetical protein